MSTNTLEPKWKKFEKLIYDIQKNLTNDAEVKLDDSIMGVDSKTSRQIDISIKRQVAQYKILIAIECKNHKDPVDINIIEEVATKIKDIRANKGAVVSSSGFTPAAIELAKVYCIDTFRLIDTENIDWKAYVSIPVLLARCHLKGCSFIFKNFEILPPEISNIDVTGFRVFDVDDKPLGTIKELIVKKWNKQEIKHEAGEKEVLLGENLFIEINDRKYRTTLIAQVEIKEECYFGNLPIHVQGFKDEQSGRVITNSIKTDRIEPRKIEKGDVKGWRKIDDPKLLCVQPTLTLYYSDIYPDNSFFAKENS